MEMKKLLTAMLLGAALFAVSGCTNAAGGGSGNSGTSGEIDYLARLIGTWETEGYASNQFITYTDPDDSSQTCEWKARLIFTSTTYRPFYEVRNSNIPSRPNGEVTPSTNHIYSIDANYFYTAPSNGGRIEYRIESNILYVAGMGPFYKK